MIMFSAAVILALGIGTMTTGIQARDSESFEKFVTMVNAESDHAFEVDKCTLSVIIIGFFIILGSLAGCYGAFSEHRGAICGFAFFLLLMGALFASLVICMAMFLQGSSPMIIKETNRLCRDPALTRQVLDCPAETMYNGQGAIFTTPSPTNQPMLGTAATTGVTPTARRLRDPTLKEHFEGLSDYVSKRAQDFGDSSHVKRVVEYLQPLGRPLMPTPAPAPRFANETEFNMHTRISISALKAHEQGGMPAMLRMLYSEMTVANSDRKLLSRRLAPGTSEKNFITNVCDNLKANGQDCSSQCQLLDELCVVPEGFNVETACVCDSKGPQKLSSADMASIVQATCPTSMVENGICMGTFCSIPNARQSEGANEEGCWVLPTTLCHKEGGFAYPGPCKSDPCTEYPYYHTGPCVDPDPRSGMVKKGIDLAKVFIGFTAFLAIQLLLTSMCSCCLFCEIHTGKKADEHARSIVYGSDSEDDETY